MTDEQRDKGRRGGGPAGDPPKKDLMAQTFEKRRMEIVEDEMKVEDALKAYPALRNYQELRREFERATGKSVNDFERHLSCVLKQYAEKQISMKYSTCSNTYCKESLAILRQGGNDNARLTAARIILFCCAQSDNNWWNVIFKVFGQGEDITIGRLEPIVLVRGDSPFGDHCAEVYCEKAKIVGGVNFFEAILACYFLYYIFNIDYPPVDRDTFKQFDNLLDNMEGQKNEQEATAEME